MRCGHSVVCKQRLVFGILWWMIEGLVWLHFGVAKMFFFLSFYFHLAWISIKNFFLLFMLFQVHSVHLCLLTEHTVHWLNDTWPTCQIKCKLLICVCIKLWTSGQKKKVLSFFLSREFLARLHFIEKESLQVFFVPIAANPAWNYLCVWCTAFIMYKTMSHFNPLWLLLVTQVASFPQTWINVDQTSVQEGFKPKNFSKIWTFPSQTRPTSPFSLWFFLLLKKSVFSSKRTFSFHLFPCYIISQKT